MTALTVSAPFELAQRQINILVIGCGGNGSSFIQNSLYRLHVALKGLGHDFGLKVWVADGELVSETNVLRSAFYPQDIGQNKAYLLASRMNLSGLNADFEAIQENLTPAEVSKYINTYRIDFVIGAVDDAQFRVNLVDYFARPSFNGGEHECMYLDMGNENHTGQCIFGTLVSSKNTKIKLPTVVDLFPEIRTIKTDKKRSCSAAESFSNQGILINQQCALIAGRILADYLTKPSIAHHGAIFDLDKMTMTPIKINPKVWEVYGYKADIDVEKQQDKTLETV